MKRRHEIPDEYCLECGLLVHSMTDMLGGRRLGALSQDHRQNFEVDYNKFRTIMKKLDK